MASSITASPIHVVESSAVANLLRTQNYGTNNVFVTPYLSCTSLKNDFRVSTTVMNKRHHNDSVIHCRME